MNSTLSWLFLWEFIHLLITGCLDNSHLRLTRVPTFLIITPKDTSFLATSRTLAACPRNQGWRYINMFHFTITVSVFQLFLIITQGGLITRTRAEKLESPRMKLLHPVSHHLNASYSGGSHWPIQSAQDVWYLVEPIDHLFVNISEFFRSHWMFWLVTVNLMQTSVVWTEGTLSGLHWR